jgi:hypothetical protein
MAMHLVPPSAFRGRRILVVESEPQLLRELLSALEGEGAETIYVTDPYSDAGAKRIGGFTYCAAAINAVHCRVTNALDVPALIYGPHASVPAEAGAITQALRAMLSAV